MQPLNLLGRFRIHRPRHRFVTSFLNDSNPVDVILLAYELFSGDHQFVQVVHEAEGCADCDAVVP